MEIRKMEIWKKANLERWKWQKMKIWKNGNWEKSILKNCTLGKINFRKM